jgi:lysine-specific demethylase 8
VTGPERLDRPSAAELDRCIAGHRPAILSGLMDDQPASERWDLSYFRRKLGACRALVVEQESPRLHWDPAAGLPLRQRTFDDLITRAFDQPGAGFSYLQDDVNNIPALRDDYRLPPMIQQRGIVRGKFWMSGPGLITPLHYDPVETFHWMVRGRKRFRCYVPGVRRYYPYSWRSTAPFISQVDPDHVDPARHPRFVRAASLDFEVGEGEILYLPAFWWHQVYSRAPVNVSVNFVWWASLARSARHLPQLVRSGRHLLVQYRKARAAARAAALQRPLPAG